MSDSISNDKIVGFDPWTAAVHEELTVNAPVYSQKLANDMTLDIQAGHDSFWLVVRRAGKGGIAFRTAYAPGGTLKVKDAAAEGKSPCFTLQTPLGEFQVKVELLEADLLHWTTALTPAFALTLPFGPRDIYPLDNRGGPIGAQGTVHAGQPNGGAAVLFLTQSEPAFGSALYLQNFSALNPLFEKLSIKPSGLVGGLWPQLGFALPASDTPLPASEKIVISDAFVCLSADQPADERQAARLFLDSLAAIYPHLPQPETQWRDWPARAADTLKDLQSADGCLVKRHRKTYALPYLAAEEPDSMVQLALTLPLYEYEDWTGVSTTLAEALRKGVPAFYDEKLGAMRRYLPGADADKDRNESDSWYLYHPLLDLARLAKRGDAEARQLLLGSLEHGIKAAQHFKYRWPIKFHLETLEVLTDVRKPDEPGQSDVSGIYAAVMLRAWDLTGEKRYFNEAKAAIRALSGYRFAVGYQFNITAIGVDACLWLWRETGDDFFRDQSLLLLASFFHHTTFNNCQLGTAKFFPSFMSVLCLHDAEYAAVFEAFESFAAFHEIFNHCGEDLPDSARLLVTEYCRHLLDRAWFYYPSELPEEALATEIRNGHLDRNIAIPMEDLYPAGEPAGAVGQEVYGAGAAFAFATRTFQRHPGVPFQVACDYPLSITNTSANCAEFHVYGVPTFSCRMKLISESGSLPDVSLRMAGKELTGAKSGKGQIEYAIPGGSDLEVRW